MASIRTPRAPSSVPPRPFRDCPLRARVLDGSFCPARPAAVRPDLAGHPDEHPRRPGSITYYAAWSLPRGSGADPMRGPAVALVSGVAGGGVNVIAGPGNVHRRPTDAAPVPVPTARSAIPTARRSAELGSGAQGSTVGARQRTSARFVAGLFATSIVVQRFAVPGLSVVELLLPVSFGWAAWGLHRRILVVDRFRLMLWSFAAGACALIVPVQALAVPDARVSITSYALFLVVWLPGVLRLRAGDSAGYLLALRLVTRIALVLAVVCILMVGSQLAGLAYRDWLAAAVPPGFLLQDFVITYPMAYGSSLYRANAWIGLEPSIVSLQLGIGFLAALLTRQRWPTLLVLGGGIVCTAAGSGMAIVGVGVLVLLLHRFRGQILRYAPAGLAALAMVWLAPWGADIYSRLTEFTNRDSSTSLRSVLPYQYLWRFWADPPVGILLGHGPGSSQVLVTQSRIVGLLVPTPVKVFFDYGVAAGLVLAAFLLFCYLGGPSRSLAVTLLVSLWLIQPGTTVVVIVIQVFLMVTWWAPRHGTVLENVPDGGPG